jgi:protein-disulfide isomerase
MTSRGWGQNSPRDFANKFGLNYSDLLECTTDVPEVVTDNNLAQAAGVTGTPFVLYRTGDSGLLPMQAGQAPSYDQLRAFVDTVLLVQ